jgi:hypothetical protein
VAERLRRWRLRRAALRLADLNEFIGKWSWSHNASETYRYERMLKRRERRVERLGGDPEAVGYSVDWDELERNGGRAS